MLDSEFSNPGSHSNRMQQQQHEKTVLNRCDRPPPALPAISLYPRALERNWTAMLQPKHCGFANLDNTGYMNAVLQVLFHIPPFLDWLLHEKCSNKSVASSLSAQDECEEENNSLTFNLQHLMKLMCQNSIVEPFNVLMMFRSICPGIEFGVKVDALMYMESIIRLLHEEFLQGVQMTKLDFWSERTSPLYQLFGLSRQVKSKCNKCSFFGELYESQLSLSLAIDSVSNVQEAIDRWLTAIPFTGCTCSVAPIEGVRKWPMVLILQLERFDKGCNKVLRPIDITFDLSVAGHSYRFSSVINDSGSDAESAHLTAAVFDSGGIVNFIDSQVTRVSLPRFLYSEFYKLNSYILLYEQVISNSATMKEKGSFFTTQSTSKPLNVLPRQLPTSSRNSAPAFKRKFIIPSKDYSKSLKSLKANPVASTSDKQRSLLLSHRRPSPQLVFHFKDSQVEAPANKQDNDVIPLSHDNLSDSKNEKVSCAVVESKGTRTIGVQVNFHRPCISYEECKVMEQARFRFFTGLTQENFLALYNFIGGDEAIDALEKESNLNTRQKKLQTLQLSNKERLFITLVRLRRGIPVFDLAKLYDVSFSVISKNFCAMIRHMSHKFQSLKDKMFISAEAQKRNKPKAFKPFKNFRVILDGFEVKIQKPFNSISEGNVNSSSMSSNTVSFLVGLSCNGSVIFVGSGYEGSLSDKNVVLKSGLLEKLEKKDQVMTDQGFDINNELLEIGVELLKPPTTCRSRKTSKKEIWARAIVEVRTYVQNVIGEIRKYRLLRCTVPQRLLPILPDMAFVSACLVNFCNPSVRLKNTRRE